MMNSWKWWKVEDEESSGINFAAGIENLEYELVSIKKHESFFPKNEPTFLFSGNVFPITNQHTDPHPCIRLGWSRSLLLTSALSMFWILFFETFAIEANSNSNCRAIFKATFRNQGHGHEFEKHVELELLFLVRKNAREAASLGATGHDGSRVDIDWKSVCWLVIGKDSLDLEKTILSSLN